MFIEITEWKRTINISIDELSKKMDRLVELLRDHSHSFILEKIEHFQELIIELNEKCIRTRSDIQEHEFRMQAEKFTNTEINILILQHQVYRNEWEKRQLQILNLTMEFNRFFVDQLNSIVEFGDAEINSASLQVSYR
jgi:glutathionylspermidine synthase